MAVKRIVKRKPATTVVKKKRWMPILAPKAFGAQPMGQTYVESPQEAIGRSITVSMMVLTGDPAKQAIHLRFKIDGKEKDDLTTSSVSYEIALPAIRKLARRGRKKIADSFICKTKDEKLVRIKPIIVTRYSATGSVLSALKRVARALYPRAIATLTFDEFMSEIVEHKLQRAMLQTMRKIYPLHSCELRWAGLCTDAKAVPLPVTEGPMPGEPLKPQRKKSAPKAEEKKPEEQVPAKTEPQSDAAMGA